MDKWAILEIDKTKDIDKIKNAYRKKLVKVNPEDDPEGFMTLRKAYEQAIYEAEQPDEKTEEDEDPLFLTLSEIYTDFSRRIDINEWKTVFDQDEFVSLETADVARQKVLVFILDHSFIPHNIMKLIVETLDIDKRRDELSEIFAPNFIEFILRNATYRDSINYEIFECVQEDVDSYIHQYYQMDSALQSGNEDAQIAAYEALIKLKSKHPYAERCRLLMELQKICRLQRDEDARVTEYQEELLELQRQANQLLKRYPDEYAILVMTGDIALIRKDVELGRDIFEHAKVLYPDSYRVKGQLAEIAFMDGEFEKARDMFMDMLDINRYDEGARQGMVRANEGLIVQIKKQIEEAPQDCEKKIQLLWCYYRNGMFEESEALLKSFEPDEENKAAYYNLQGRTYYYTQRYEQALEGFLKWRKALEEQPEWEDSEKLKKKNHGLQYSNYFLGECCIDLKKYEEARVYLANAIEKDFPEIIYAYEAMCRLEFESENYEACVRACHRVLERDEEDYDSCIYMAKSFFELGQYGNVIDICDRAIMINPYITEPYIYELKVYWNVDRFDNMRSVIKSYERFGIISDEICYFKARLCQVDDDNEKSNEYLQGILNRKENGEQTDMEDYQKVYLQYATNCHILGEFEKAIELYTQLLSTTYNPWYKKRSMLGRASAYCCLMDFEAAKKEYEDCENIYGIDDTYVIDHAELLVRMNDMDGCAKLLRKAIEQIEDDQDFLQSLFGNLCCFYGNEGFIDEAYEVFLLGIKKMPEDYLMYRSMGYIYLEHDRFEDAKKFLEKAIELDCEHRSFTYGLLALTISKLDDIFKPEYEEIVQRGFEEFADVDTAYSLIKKAEFYRGLGRYEEALEFVKNALKKPRGYLSCFLENDGAWYEMGNIYAEMGEIDKALECYEKSNEAYGHSALALAAIERIHKSKEIAYKDNTQKLCYDDKI